MKHLSLLLFLVCAACGALSPRALPQARAQELQSQKDSMVRVVQALDSVVATAKKVTGNAAFVKQFGAHGFNEEGCVFGVMLSPGASSAETFTLRKGQSYIFIGGGDQSARDIDLIITDSRGKVVNRNTNNNKTSPFARFDPPVTGRYTMTLKLQSSANGSAFCAVSVLRTGGVRLPLDRIVEAAAKVVAYSAIVFAAAEGGQFTRDRNTWAIYGAVLNSKQTISSDAKRYGNAKRGFFAVGDDRVKDLDLALVKSGGGVVAQDTQSAGVPSILYGTTAGSAYSMQLSNNYSTGPALVMGVLIDVPANFSLKALEERAAQQNGGSNNGDLQSNNSSLSGQWQGRWAGADGVQGGVLSLNISGDGALAGQLYNAAVDATVPVAGQVKADGSFFFKYSYGGTGYIAKGKMGRDDDGNLVGQAGFSMDGQTFFSSGVFQLEEQ